MQSHTPQQEQFPVHKGSSLSKSLRYLVGLLALLGMMVSFVCCHRTNDEPKKPAILLNEEQMTAVLLDVHLVESLISTKRNIGQHEEQKEAYFDLVFRKHGISKQLFDDNVLYYNRFPVMMERVYDSVTRRLERIQDSIPKPDNQDLSTGE